MDAVVLHPTDYFDALRETALGRFSVATDFAPMLHVVTDAPAGEVAAVIRWDPPGASYHDLFAATLTYLDVDPSARILLASFAALVGRGDLLLLTQQFVRRGSPPVCLACSISRADLVLLTQQFVRRGAPPVCLACSIHRDDSGLVTLGPTGLLLAEDFSSPALPALEALLID